VEEFLVVLIQFVLDVLAQAAISIPFDFCPRRDFPNSRVTYVILAVVGGGLCGAASLHFFPNSPLHYSWLRIASLAASPLIGGYFGYVVAEVRSGLGRELNSRDHFWYAFAFTLGLAVIRFEYAHHIGA